MVSFIPFMSQWNEVCFALSTTGHQVHVKFKKKNTPRVCKSRVQEDSQADLSVMTLRTNTTTNEGSGKTLERPAAGHVL